MSAEVPQTVSFWRKLVRVVIRVIFAIVLGFAIGVGVYAGIRAFALQSASLQEQIEISSVLGVRLDQFEESVSNRVDDLTQRLDTLELSADASKEKIASYEDRLNAVESAQETQADEISDLGTQVSALETAVDEMQAEQVSQDELQSMVAQVEALGSAIETSLEWQENISQTLQTIQQEFLDGPQDSPALLVQVEMLRAMQFLLRSNSYLEKGDYSQAEVEIENASNLLGEAQGKLSTAGMEYLESIVAELEQALDDLPDSPVLAANRLDTAWQLLSLGLPNDALPTPTPTP